MSNFGKLVGVLSLLTSVSSLASPVFNLNCVDSEKGAYQVSVVNDRVHFCGDHEQALITSDQETESNLRVLQLNRFEQTAPLSYKLTFASGLKNQPCPRCHGDVRYSQSLILSCELKISEQQLCVARKQGPQPELGENYNKVLRYGVGDRFWEKVPWVTLYNSQSLDFVIYTFSGKHRDEVYKYTYSFYSGQYLSDDEFVDDIQIKLKQGYRLHSYSTNDEGLRVVKETFKIKM